MCHAPSTVVALPIVSRLNRMRRSVRPCKALRLVLLACCVSLASIADLAGQETSSQSRVWLSLGLGGGFFGSTDGSGEGLGLASAITHQTGSRVISLRASLLGEILGDGVYDLGLLYGRGSMGETGRTTFGAGLALVGSEDCGGLSAICEREWTIGVPLGAGASYSFGRVLGIGIHAFANLNLVRSYIGAVLALRIGQ